MFPFDSIRFHYRRWAALRRATQGLPAESAQERASRLWLQSRFRALPMQRAEGLPQTEADWAGAMNRLRELGVHADPRAFQRWDVVIARMACVNSPETAHELEALRADRDWDSRWSVALRDVDVGRPNSYAPFPQASEILIQTVHHVMRLERLSSRRVDEWDAVLEFGGGFGGLCRVMHVLGFRGRYLLYDLPHFALLQRYYLERVGIIVPGDDRVRTTHDLGDMERFAAELPATSRGSFWATWSLSETPLALRERVRPIAERMGHFCIGFQGRYGEVDNAEWFARDWVRGPHRVERIAHRPDDYYLAGRSEGKAE